MPTIHSDLIHWFAFHSVRAVPIKLRGHSKGNTEYHKAKQPLEKGWPKSQGLTEEEISLWLDQGGWVGLIIPDGLIVVDIDNKGVFGYIIERLRSLGIKCIAIRTPNGGQLIFRDVGGVVRQSAKMITAGGIVVDYRLAGKGQIVCPTVNTENRHVVFMDGHLDDMPLFFRPIIHYDPERYGEKILPVPMREGARNDLLRAGTINSDNDLSGFAAL